MTDMDLTELWASVVEQVVEGSASPDHADGILSHATINHIDDDNIILSFPTALMKNGADRSYIEKIQDALFGIIGKDLAVTTIIDTALPILSSPSPKTEPTPAPTMRISQPLETPYDRPNFPQAAVPKTNQRMTTREPFTMKFTFDTFVTGASNQLAYSTARGIAEQPGKSYNPLFIYGRSGLGKTHLLCAIDNYISNTQPYLQICYCAARDLLNDIINMARAKDWTLFDTKYSSADVLLIDDVQFLENKPESTERIFQLINEFQMSNKQIVLSADRSPKSLDMDERVTSRFMSGGMVDVQPPTFEMKLGIIKNYNERELGDALGDDVLNYVAEVSSSNIREVEGALSTLGIRRSIGQEITVDSAREILKDYFRNTESRQITIKLIQSEVEHYFGITHEEIVSDRRDRKYNNPRQIAMYLSKEMTDESFPSIGKKFGGRDHSTVMHGVKRVESQMKESREYVDTVETIRDNIKKKA